VTATRFGPRIERALRILRRAEDATLLVVAVALIAAVLLQVLSRYAVGRYVSLAWTDEIARGLMIWLTFIGAAVLERERDHIRVTLAIDLMGPRGRAFADILSDILCAAFLVLVLVSVFDTLRADFSAVMLSVPLPLAVVSVALALGSLAMLVHVGLRIWVEGRDLFGP